MITVKLISYDNETNRVVESVFYISDEAMNDISIVEKILRASCMPFNLMSHIVDTDGDSDFETIVLSFPSFLRHRLDDIAEYLRLGLCLALVIDS